MSKIEVSVLAGANELSEDELVVHCVQWGTYRLKEDAGRPEINVENHTGY